MNNMTFKLKKVSSALTSKRLYRASAQSNGVVGHDELAERLAERTKQDTNLWKHFLDTLTDEIARTSCCFRAESSTSLQTIPTKAYGLSIRKRTGSPQLPQWSAAIRRPSTVCSRNRRRQTGTRSSWPAEMGRANLWPLPSRG